MGVDAPLLDWQGALSACLQAVQTSQHAPLSARHALQAAAFFDLLADRAYVQGALKSLSTAADILAFRTALRQCHPALGPLMDLMAAGAHLRVVATPVPPDGFASLDVADLMVSLYNAGTVPRLMLIQPDGTSLPMQDLLQNAAGWWATALS